MLVSIDAILEAQLLQRKERDPSAVAALRRPRGSGVALRCRG